MKEQQLNIIILISNNLFKGTKSLTKSAFEALNNAIKKVGKDKPTLNNRL